MDKVSLNTDVCCRLSSEIDITTSTQTTNTQTRTIVVLQPSLPVKPPHI